MLANIDSIILISYLRSNAYSKICVQDYNVTFMLMRLMKVELKWYFKTSMRVEFSSKENS